MFKRLRERKITWFEIWSKVLLRRHLDCRFIGQLDAELTDFKSKILWLKNLYIFWDKIWDLRAEVAYRYWLSVKPLIKEILEVYPYRKLIKPSMVVLPLYVNWWFIYYFAYQFEGQYWWHQSFLFYVWHPNQLFTLVTGELFIIFYYLFIKYLERRKDWKKFFPI